MNFPWQRALTRWASSLASFGMSIRTADLPPRLVRPVATTSPSSLTLNETLAGQALPETVMLSPGSMVRGRTLNRERSTLIFAEPQPGAARPQEAARWVSV